MSKERMLETIGQVKDEFIEEAAPKGLLSDNTKKEKSAKMYQFVKWGALAACLCLIVGLGMKMNLFSASKEDFAFQAKDQMKPTTESIKQDAEAESPNYGLTNKADADNYSINDTVSSDTREENMANTEAGAEVPECDKGFPDWGLILSVKNVTPTGLTLVVTQSGGNPTGELMTGEPYRLITLVDGTWKTVEELPLPEGVDGRGFNSIGYPLPKGETREFDINWEWMFGELPNGTYRLIKEFMDFRGTANYDTFEYWVEFEIK